jgi:SAM-dependent methyltransferase
VKLSMMPWSTYAKRPGIAPRYLASTMPYTSWRPGEPVPQAVELAGYHRELVDAEAQFEHQETTLSHLLRIAHPALAGRSYGEALVDAVIARGLPAGRVRVLEIGGGLGYVAQAAIARLRASGREVDYTIVELSPALAEAQRSKVLASPGRAATRSVAEGRSTAEATWIAGDVLDARIDGSFELVLANEMVGDLPAKQLSRSDLGLALDGTGEVDPAKLRAIAPLAGELGVHLDDAPEPFYLQTGAIELVAKIARWLAPGGIAVVTEFGDVARYPTPSTHLDHPELSTHFGHLLQAARSAGLDANVEFVIDLLDLDRTQTGLATTRSHFRALRAVVANAGVELAKIGYTPELLAHAIGGALDLATIGELRWDRIEDRLMGLVPHEFKALIAKRAR